MNPTLCKNCLYFRIDYECRKRRFVIPDYITGGSVISYAKCGQKNHDGMCKDYESKKTLLRRILRWLTVY